MTPAISTAIVGTQVALIVLGLLIGVIAKQRVVALGAAWAATVLALIAIGIAGAAAGGAVGADGETTRFITYGIIAFIAAAVSWGVVAVVSVRLRSAQERYYAKPETRELLSEELREVLRAEGISLDERLARAEQEREQFLYALEDQHAKQIAGLAQEYQHEASTVLRGLIDQIAGERLIPAVERQLEEQRAAIEHEMRAIDGKAASEDLAKARAEYAKLTKELDAATKRVAELRDENPETTVEERIADRVSALEESIAERLREATVTVEERTIARAADLEANLARVDELLNAKIAEAGNPLVARMTETQGAVEQQLNAWMGVLDGRFNETEGILNQRILEQEHALEGRVVELEASIEERLGQHVAAVESVLADHDSQLQQALTDQSSAIGTHFSTERDRLIAELTEHGVRIQETVASELMGAEQRAREAVEATQTAWNSFTDELETRFAETREEAMQAAKEIATEEHDALRIKLVELTSDAQADISGRVEEIAREAAWQRAQVERSVRDTIDVLQTQAQEAVGEADRVFADLERIGSERVERIRRDAEDALVQSREYVGQLQESLSTHLEDLRTRSGQVADEMSDRLTAITQASQDGATQLEQYARDVVEATTRELGAVSERATTELQARINDEFTATVQSSIEAQQRASELHLDEFAQRMIQQVQGDLAGLAEHARAAVTGELDQIIQSSRQHAQEAQDRAFREVMSQLARSQAELAEQARGASGEAKRTLEEGLRDGRRQLDEAMASMGAHMREELVRFQDEGQRRVDQIVNGLRNREQDLVREEDRKLSQARQELVRQHQGALEQQVRSMVGGLSGSLDLGAPTTAASGSFTQGIDRPNTPLSGGFGA